MFIEKVLRQGAAPAAERPEKVLSVCFVAPHAWPVLSRDPHIKVVGGAEVQQAIIARLLAARGLRVSMVTLDYGQPDGAVVDGVTVYKSFTPDGGLPVLRFLHPRMSSMLRAMRAADADVYYYRSTSMWAGVMAEFARRHGRRSIYAGASDRDFAPGTGGQVRYARDRWLFSHALRTVDRIVVQNLKQQAACRALSGRDAIHIPSCYQLPADARPFQDDRVLWVGTIQTHKRPELLLELARRLPQRRFVMIGGEMPGHAELYQQIRREAEATPNVEFKGFLPLAQVEQWFDRARVHVTTSRFEGMPNVCLQAWARGLPTVGTLDVGARLDGKPVYPVHQDLDAFAAQVEKLFQDEDAWKASSDRVREYFERTHSPAEVVARYSSLLRELVAASLPRGLPL
jgi:glycosyltransferase involved in cell wall biosynthesis